MSEAPRERLITMGASAELLLFWLLLELVPEILVGHFVVIDDLRIFD